ncbi:hypothetical protein SAMN04490239_0157 [Rhodococcus koreensis]|uniref:Uncharacterized protein n=1 Tax=Rhodococcus koreensis TaxID=99653 RepID=A0A1H4I9B7_9NOCA|nr:hypothetical protein SAMN04490239_0157 [Rhodococcus koreensis]
MALRAWRVDGGGGPAIYGSGVCRSGWPAVSAPTTGVRKPTPPSSAPSPRAAPPDLTLHPTAIRAYPTGLEMRMLFTADGALAVLARHKTPGR